MFPIAHAWLLTQLIPQPTNAHFLGCVWPDMLYGSPLTHDQSHRSGAALVALVERVAPEERAGLRAFVIGVLTHGAEPHGFDWYSDERYADAPPEERGYAFQVARPLAESAARACDVPAEQGWWKAHNLVEMSFERPLYVAEPALGDRLAVACADEPLIARIAWALAEYFPADPAALAAPMRRFPAVVALQPTTTDALAQIYARQTRLRTPGAEPDVAAIASLIEEAQSLTTTSREQFLRTCVREVGQMLTAHPPTA
jgi:hypothetical protein